LDEFAKKYNSPILRRSVDLLKSEIISGGKVADVLDQLVASLRKTRELKKEMSATALSYMIFMSVIVLLVTPALFALSKQLLVILIGLGTKISGSVSGGASVFSFTAPEIEEGSFHLFAMAAVGMIAIFTSVIISIIEKGDIKGGLKYLPVFLVGSVLMYILMAALVQYFMGGLVAI
jgi:hypothetical protein